MATLRLFGWIIAFDPANAGPVAKRPGATLWSLRIELDGGPPRLRGAFTLRVGNVWIEAEVDLLLQASGSSSWVPASGVTSVLNTFRMRRHDEPTAIPGAPDHRFLIGPVRVAPTAPPQVAWDAQTGALIVNLTGNLAGLGTVGDGLRLDFTGKPCRIDLQAQTVTLAEGGIRALAYQWPAGGAPVFTATLLSLAQPALTLTEIGQTKAELSIRLRLAGGSKEIWLHGGEGYGPGLIARNGDLQITVKEAAGHRRHEIIALALNPASTAGVALELCGAMNTSNLAEVWTSDVTIPLALSLHSKTGRFNGLVIHPQALCVLKRRTPDAGNLPVHGGRGGHRFELPQAATGALVSDRAVAESGVEADRPPWLAKTLDWRVTRPWLRFDSAVYRHPRYGEAYGGQGAEDHLLTLRSSGPSGGVPATPPEDWQDGDPVAVIRFKAQLDAAMTGFVVARRDAVHETGLSDSTPQSDSNVTALYASPAEAFPLRLQTHGEVRALSNTFLGAGKAADAGALEVRSKLKPDADLEYTLLWPGVNWRRGQEPPFAEVTDLPGQLLSRAIDPNVPIAIKGVQHWDPGGSRQRHLPYAIFKLGRKMTLAEILADVGERLAKSDTYAAALLKSGQPLAKLISEVDPAIARADWIGVVVLDLELDLSGLPQLQTMAPTADAAGPVLDFVAISPQPAKSSAWGGVSGAVSWSRSSDSTEYVASKYDNLDEARFWTQRLDIRWRDGALAYFRSEAILELRSFLGTGLTRNAAAAGGRRQVQIIGSARRRDKPADQPPEYDFRFAADTRKEDPRGLQIYPIRPDASEAAEGVIEEVWLRRIEVAATQATAPEVGKPPKVEVEVQIDGEAKFKPPAAMTAVDFLKGKSVNFFDLGISLPSLSNLDIPGLKLRYPDLRFDLNLPHVGLLGDALKIKFQDFNLDWNHKFDFGQWPDLGLGDFLGAGGDWIPDVPAIIIGGRLSFGRLPELFSKGFSDFSLDLAFGLQIDTSLASVRRSLRLGVKGFGFEGLNFDLLPFLTLRMERLALTRTNTPRGAKLDAIGLSISVMGHTLPYTLNGGFWSQSDGPDAFWVSADRTSSTRNLIDFNYGFIGQNLDFSQAGAAVKGFLEAILLDDPSLPKPEPMTENIFEKAWSEGRITPAKAGGEGAGWTFAADLGALYGLMRGRVIVQDRGFTGLALFVSPEAKAITDWFGDGFAIVGLYHKGQSPEDDYFHVSLTLPQMDMPAFRMTGGVLAVTIWTNGGVQLDFGFPWPIGATRQWERTIGLIITPGQASAGFYVLKRHQASPEGTELVLGAGFALQWGLGAAWGGGSFKAWGRIGVYGVLTGEAAFLAEGGDLKLRWLRVTGAVGVLVEGAGKIDWWVISVEVGVRATAEMRIELYYRPAQPTLIDLHASLYVSAYARACVGGGWFKVCRSIRVGLSVPVHHRLTV